MFLRGRLVTPASRQKLSTQQSAVAFSTRPPRLPSARTKYSLSLPRSRSFTHLARLSDLVHDHQEVVELVHSTCLRPQPSPAVERRQHEKDPWRSNARLGCGFVWCGILWYVRRCFLCLVGAWHGATLCLVVCGAGLCGAGSCCLDYLYIVVGRKSTRYKGRAKKDDDVNGDRRRPQQPQP